MSTEEQIHAYLDSQPPAKRSDMLQIHDSILQALPKARLWFSDGRNAEGKVISNPTIGYGLHTLRYADGSSREYFKIGLLANATGISLHILGIEDKEYLYRTFGPTLGKAKITGYCIRFKALKGLDLNTLQAVLRYACEASEV